eukprot:3200074-Prymnesium_polylepis.2
MLLEARLKGEVCDSQDPKWGSIANDADKIRLGEDSEEHNARTAREQDGSDDEMDSVAGSQVQLIAKPAKRPPKEVAKPSKPPKGVVQGLLPWGRAKLAGTARTWAC